MIQRRRGRPPKSAEEHEQLRERVTRATAVVFGRRGYHGLKVEEVLEEAGFSRPTFYAHFQNVDEPLEAVLTQVNASLVVMVSEAAASPADPADMLQRMIEAYLAWGVSMGPMLRPLYAELHDPLSPVSRHRTRALRTLRDVVSAATVAAGRPHPQPLAVDLLISGFEYLGYRYHLATKRDPVARSETLEAMFRLALATLGEPDDWRIAAAQFPQGVAAEAVGADGSARRAAKTAGSTGRGR